MKIKIIGPKLSWCGLCLSVWAVLQLTFLGICYRLRTISLIEDLPELSDLKTDDPEELKEALNFGYDRNSRNCFVAAGIYVITLIFFSYQAWVNKLPKGSQYENFYDRPE